MASKKQAEDKTEQQDLHLVDSHGPASVEAESVPVVGKDVKFLPLLQAVPVGVTCHEPTVVPTTVTQKSSSVSWLAEISFSGILLF